MRICVLSRGVPDEESPLNGLYEWGHAVLLRKLGYAVTFVAVDLRVGRSRKKSGLSRYEKEGVDVFDYGLPVGAVAKRAAVRLRSIAVKKILVTLIIEGRKPDLVWAYFGRTLGDVALGVKKRFGIPYAVSEYEARLLTDKKSGRKGNPARAYASAALLTAPNPAFCQRLCARYDRDFLFLPPSVTSRGDRILHDKYTFLSIGSLTVEKGMDVVIRAFASVKKARPDVRLVIAGTGEEKRALSEQAEALNVANDVTFLSAASGEELKKIMRASDCFVLASRKELYGTLYLEVMAEGLPILTTDCFSPGGLIPGLAGKIVPVDDVLSLSVCMTEASGEICPFDRASIRAYAENNFSVRAVGAKIEKALAFLQKPDLPVDIQ